MSDDVNDFLFAEGGKSFKFTKIGDTVKGTVVKAKVGQQTSIDGQKLTWDDGSPRKQLVVTLQTDDQDNDDDDGVRMIYAKGGNFEVAKGEGTSMRNAIADAVKDAGADKLEPGDELAVCYTGESKARRGYSPAKLYVAGFKKTVGSVAASDLFGDHSEDPILRQSSTGRRGERVDRAIYVDRRVSRLPSAHATADPVVGCGREQSTATATASLSGRGKATSNNHQPRIYAHRWVWEAVNGPIPKGLVVRHKCDNRLCFRLSHLELGTVADNNRDTAERNHLGPVRTLSPSEVEAILARRAAGESWKQIHADYSTRRADHRAPGRTVRSRRATLCHLYLTQHRSPTGERKARHEYHRATVRHRRLRRRDSEGTTSSYAERSFSSCQPASGTARRTVGRAADQGGRAPRSSTSPRASTTITRPSPCAG